MESEVREDEQSAPWLKRSRQDTETGTPVVARRLTDALAFRDIVRLPPVVANLVQRMGDWNIPDDHVAKTLAVKVFPSNSPYFIIQYRVPIGSTQKFGGTSRHHRSYRNVATRVQTGVVTVRPNGPLGVVIMRLRPESAARILGPHMRDFADAKIGLGDVFKARDISLLEERVSEAPSAAQRCICVLRFLLANARERDPDPIACRAAAMLGRRPSLRVRQLAAELDVSERHLSRKFQAMFGIGPKQFARTARIEKALTARDGGSTWADIAYACGFADQAHLINDFNAITGAPPEHAMRPPSVEQHQEMPDSSGAGIMHDILVW
jgi:AraC-like DNA-binding protein